MIIRLSTGKGSLKVMIQPAYNKTAKLIRKKSRNLNVVVSCRWVGATLGKIDDLSIYPLNIILYLFRLLTKPYSCDSTLANYLGMIELSLQFQTL